MRVLLLTIAIAIVLYLVLQKWWKRISVKYSPSSGSIPSSTYALTDWTGALSVQAQRYAVKEFCTQKGYSYAPPTDPNGYGECLYNEQTCKSDSNPHWVSCLPVTGATGGVDPNGNPCDLNQKPYLEWHLDANGEGRCVVSHFPPAFIQNLCENKGLGEWHPGALICDATGYCQINPDDIPTCKLTSQYCDRMGLDYQDAGGLGDCNLSDWQNVVEGIFGKTLTRTFKRNTEAMIRECSDSVFSANCAASIGTELTTGGQIALETVDTEFKGYMNTLQNACTGDTFSSVEHFYSCSTNLLPFFYLGAQAQEFADNMLNGCLGWIPGMPKGLIGKGMALVGKFGIFAVQALFHAGELAIQAFEIAGDIFFAALNVIGLGPVADIIRGACKAVIQFGARAAHVIANVANSVVHIFANDIVPAVFHAFDAVVSAVLHPAAFFESVAADIATLVSDPVRCITNAITAIAKLGGPFLDAAQMVVNKLRLIASQALTELATQLHAIADALESAFSSFGSSLLGDLEQVGSAITSIF